MTSFSGTTAGPCLGEPNFRIKASGVNHYNAGGYTGHRHPGKAAFVSSHSHTTGGRYKAMDVRLGWDTKQDSWLAAGRGADVTNRGVRMVPSFG